MPLTQDIDTPAKGSGEESYESFDPAAVRPSPLDPSQSSSAPGDLAESHGGSDVLPTADVFDERFKEPFTGLAFIGALSKTFSWLGHEFHIRTLTTDEILAVASITAQYEGGLGENRAYITAVVALCTERVDGEMLPYPYKESTGIGWAQDRFNYVKGQWFTYTVDAVYEEYLILEGKVREVLNAMGNVSG